MKLATASVEYGRVLNLGDYNSVRVTCTLGAELESDDELDDVMRDLWEMARENVRAQTLRLTDRAAARAEEVFLGLPKQLQDEIKEEQTQ